MARSRNIKPGFFINSKLGKLSALHRLLFIGLWTIADRLGRLLDRPNQIRASVLPYDRCNPSRMLQDLHDNGFILRYEIQGDKYIQIINFLKHQNPHVKEQKSTIPAPCSAPDMPDTCTSNALLIPDSLNLIPDSNDTLPQEIRPPETQSPKVSSFEGLESETPKPTKAGTWATDLRRRGVSVTSAHPTLLALIEEGHELPAVIDALQIARLQKPEPEQVAINYLAKIVRTPQKQASSNWWSDESDTLKKGLEFGLEPKRGESWDDFRQRIRQEAARPKGKTLMQLLEEDDSKSKNHAQSE